MEDNGRLSGTREEIMLLVYNRFLVPRFAARGYKLPNNVRMSVGSPMGNAAGVTFHPRVGQNYFHIFIQPYDMFNYQEFFGTLIHEAIHTLFFDHKADFQRCADAVGLLPPYVSTTASPELVADFDRWWEENILLKGYKWDEPSLEYGLGQSGGGGSPGGGTGGGGRGGRGGRGGGLRPIGAPKPQTGRMVKLVCPVNGYIIRTARGNIDKFGYPYFRTDDGELHQFIES